MFKKKELANSYSLEMLGVIFGAIIYFGKMHVDCRIEKYIEDENVFG